MTGYRCGAARERPPDGQGQGAGGQLRFDAAPSELAASEVAWPEAALATKADSSGRRAGRINIDAENLGNGLAQLVLALVRLLHELLEKQAIRRIEAGRMSEAQCERIGVTLMKQSEQLEKLRRAFGLSEEDLNLDLGPLGRLL